MHFSHVIMFSFQIQNVELRILLDRLVVMWWANFYPCIAHTPYNTCNLISEEQAKGHISLVKPHIGHIILSRVNLISEITLEKKMVWL